MAHPPLPDTGPRYLNRELSHLSFDERVLALAEDASLPLLERVRFLAILSQNLDEFYQVRVAGLKEQQAVVPPPVSPDGLTPGEQLSAIRRDVDALEARQSRVFNQDLLPRLAQAGIHFLRTVDLNHADQAYLADVFNEQIFPVLTPLAVDPAHPFPYISNLSLNLAVMVREPLGRRSRFARVKVPPVLPRFIPFPEGRGFVPLEQVIAAHLDVLFPGMEIVGHHPFRVTRDADLDLVDDEAEDLLAAIQMELRRRRRQAPVVRLEIDSGMSEEVLGLLLRELEIDSSDVYLIDGLLDLGALWAIYQLDRPDLKEEPWAPVTQIRLKEQNADGEGAELFDVMREGDVLVHHPYESFATSVEAFIDAAAADPGVLAIKQTLYRTSGPASPIVRSLIRAAETGKQVVALVELKARGDEQANIAWAQALEEAGVHVVYGVVGLKTHAKVTLVVRHEPDGIRRYVHVGTGNYNPRTALTYEDVGLLTADPDIGHDAGELFNFLTGYSRQRQFRKLVVAPLGMRANLTQLIRREATRPDGRIVLKVNHLVDPEIIDALYEAAQAGVDIDLVVRGLCALRPGVPGFSQRIRVRSIVGRFLEHSRIFRFGSDREGVQYYLGSADLMPRNLDRRVEAVTPILDPALKARLAQIMEVVLSDDQLAWQLNPDGTWEKVPTRRGINSQRRFEELALARAQGLIVRDGD
ncbi:MAG: polyphosphate kinase 1 [Chloroflexi bacterium]|nr:MAG: polyphosphate kinase 1 [Chloroflexota bacterium]